MDASGLFLGIDTATPYLTLALWSPAEGAVASFAERVGRDHAKRLLPELDRLLGRAGRERRELVGIAVGVGPGSYTGLRVGLASAQGLARGLGLALGGVSTLEAMAAGALREGAGAVTLDAGRGRVYVAAYRREGARLRALSEALKLERADTSARFPGLIITDDLPPDPAYLAARAANGDLPAAKALYL